MQKVFSLWYAFFEDKFEDTKGVIRIRKSKDRQYNDEKKKRIKGQATIYKITQKTKDRATRTPLKTEDDLKRYVNIQTTLQPRI